MLYVVLLHPQRVYYVVLLRLQGFPIKIAPAEFEVTGAVYGPGVEAATVGEVAAFSVRPRAPSRARGIECTQRTKPR